MGSKLRESPSNSNPYISPRYRADDWRRLDLNSPTNPDWMTAVDIFLDRLCGRFLTPIEAIINHPDCEIQEFSGFTIIAIDCLLIETLNQFYRGTDETVGRHEDAFWDFFRGSRFFKNEFDTKQKAEIFYRHFRCGILHQAQTKKLSKIRIGMPAMAQLSVPGRIKEGLIIDRQKFHQALFNEINDYADKLKNPKTQKDLDLGGKFVKKMLYIVH